MARNLDSQEVKSKILSAFPPRSGELFYQLWNDVALLHANWKNYRAFFGTSPERIDLLNWAASSFFVILDGILRHDIIMQINRLLDPPRSLGNENVSLARLVEAISSNAETAFLEKIKSKLNQLQDCCKPIREIRNRLLAHKDQATALSYHQDPLPGISRAYIEDILQRICDILGDIEYNYLAERTHHEIIITFRDAESVIFQLAQAREYEELKEKEFKKRYGVDK